MIRLTPALLLTLLVATGTDGLSAHSPKDLYAYPKFQVVLSDNSILNSTVMDSRQKTDQDPSPSAPITHLLRTPAGQAFLCSVPPPSPVTPARSSRQPSDESTRACKNGLAKGLKLLEGMRNGCLFLRQGYFTYSFCYGSEIRQFHEIRISGSLSPSPDPSVESYTLGQFPARSSYLTTPKYGSGSELAANGGIKVEASLGGEGGEGGRYLVQKWEGGSTCDKTGLPRSVEVQFHCNTASTDRIALIRETAICQYVLLLHTPRLCSEPVFLEGREDPTDPPSVVECRPVVDKITEKVDQADTSGNEKLAVGGESSDGLRTLSPPTVDSSSVEFDDQEGEEFREESDEPGAMSVLRINSDFIPEENMITITYDAETGAIQTAVTSEGVSIFDKEGEVNALLVDGQDEGAAEVTPERLNRLSKIMQKSIEAALNPTDPSSELPPPSSSDIVDRLNSILQEMSQNLTPEQQALLAKIKETADSTSRSEFAGRAAKVLGGNRGKKEKVEGVKRERLTNVASSSEHAKLREMFGKVRDAVDIQEKEIVNTEATSTKVREVVDFREKKEEKNHDEL